MLAPLTRLIRHPILRLLITLSLCLGITSHSQAITLTIAAGAGYKRPINELANAFERKTGITVEALYGNMGQVLTQTIQSDRIAVIFGDQHFLENAKQVNFSQYLPAGRGRLVLAWAKGKSLSSPEGLTNPTFSRVALPDVRHAIYGKAASEFLNHSGLAAKLPKPLLTVATVPQVSAYLISGEMDAGFINLTEALAISDRIGGYIEIDSSQYEAISIVGAIVQGREQTPGVRELTHFMNTEEARAILSKHGL